MLGAYSPSGDQPLAVGIDPNYIHFPRNLMTALGLPPQASEKMWSEAVEKVDGAMEPRVAVQVFNGLVESVMKSQNVAFNAAWTAAKSKSGATKRSSMTVRSTPPRISTTH